FQACHSPQSANDFKLRSGSIGSFSSVALRKNYELFRNEFMAVEFPDARRGRAVAKAILDDDDQRVPTGVLGIIHRGGPVLETPGPLNGADPAVCPTNFDPSVTPATPFCIVQEWLRRERVALIAAGDATDFGAAGAKIVFVNRPAASADAGRLEFDTFRGGGSLLAVNAAFDALGVITAPIDIAGATNLSQSCAGLAAGGDIQAPNVANDGDRVVFAARASAADALGVYVVSLSTGTCTKISAAAADSNGLKVHDFDPVFSPDGANVVFASTRGKAGALKSRKRLLPQSDLWRAPITNLTADLANAEQMTFLSNSELGPAFMREGRVTMTTEKASAGFYQLAGRRINWDLTDYHPLLAQRKDSLFVDPTMSDLTTANPSIGYSSATDIVEASNGDFLLILADVDTTTGAPAVPGAAGALAVFNRSIGPFEQGRTDTGYLQALRILDAGSADGRGGGGGYRRPRSLPDGRIMAAFASNVGNHNFAIVMVDPRTQVRSPLLTGAGGDVQVDAVLAYAAPPRQLYENRRQLVFGGSVDGAADATLHLPDAPMTFTLLVANLRRGRPLDAFDEGRFLAVFREGTCPPTGCTAPGGLFEQRTLLGRVPLEDDGSVKVALPSGQGVVFQLEDADGNVIATMGEEHQLGPGENISMGVSRTLFDGVCGGCHGSISARELDVAVTPDALTGASQSASRFLAPRVLQ
nr:PD40 domain-containing protein [Deltaproteobacteria bacterium]